MTRDEPLDDYEEPLSETVRSCYDGLDWDDDVFLEAYRIAEPMAEALRQLVQTDGFALDTIAGATVYITSHLLGRPRPLREVAGLVLVNDDHMRSIYARICADRENLITPQMLEVLGRGRMEGILAFLPPPDSDEEVVGDEDEGPSIPVSATLLRSLCKRMCYQHGYRGSIVQLAQEIAENIREGSYSGVCSPNKMIAVSIFMALRLAGNAASYERIEQLTGVVASTIRNAYHQLYPRRNRLVNSRSLEHLGRYNISSVLNYLASPLPWPPLDPEITDDQTQDDNESDEGEITDNPTQADDVSPM